MQLELIRYPLEGRIRTDFYGFCKLLELYDTLKDVYDQPVLLDFSNLSWIDANLSAVLCAIRYKLEAENRLTFKVDHRQIAGKLDVLHRNGCFLQNGKSICDERESTVPCTHFFKEEQAAYQRYVTNDLFEHRGFESKGLSKLQQANKNIATRIRTDLFEVFNNYRTHARTSAPFFVCGQYYPQNHKVVFTMVDLGVGFLRPIQEFSGGSVSTSIEAIRWALKGNSTQVYEDEPSGCGLSGILDFCNKHGGDLQVVTGDALWSTALLKSPDKGYKLLDKPFFGTSINITFNSLDSLPIIS